MNQSEDIKELAAALSEAQGVIEGAKKDSEATISGSTKRKYADLASVWDACRKSLADNGLSVVQVTEGGPDTVTVITRLMHKSGQWMEGSLTMKPQQMTPQGLGSCITYCRRYALMAMVGIAPEDDDGQAASQAPPQHQGQQRQQQTQATPQPQPQPNGNSQPIAIDANNAGASAWASKIHKLKNDNNLTQHDLQVYGKLSGTLTDLVKAGATQELQEAFNLLSEYVIIKQREAAQAS